MVRLRVGASPACSSSSSTVLAGLALLALTSSAVSVTAQKVNPQTGQVEVEGVLTQKQMEQNAQWLASQEKLK